LKKERKASLSFTQRHPPSSSGQSWCVMRLEWRASIFLVVCNMVVMLYLMSKLWPHGVVPELQPPKLLSPAPQLPGERTIHECTREDLNAGAKKESMKAVMGEALPLPPPDSARNAENSQSRPWAGSDRELVRCHPEICEQSRCDEECGQIPKMIYQCQGEECRKQDPRLIYKANLSYPAFIMKMPSFADPRIEQLFFNLSVVRKVYMFEHGMCPSSYAQKGENRCEIIGPFDKNKELVFTHKRYVYGEIIIVKDGLWAGRPNDQFGALECWEKSDYKWLLESGNQNRKKLLSLDKAAVLITPATGGAFFQHFIDRGWSKLIQIWDLLQSDPEIKILVSTSFQRHQNVEKLWKRFGLADRLVWVDPKQHQVFAKEMIFPCVATHYHPYVYQRAQRLLGVDSDVPLNKRKKIVYLTRQNKSRKVVNEKELLAALEFWLKDHDRMEELYVFEHDHWPDLNDLIRFFNQEVLAVVGPHGGAFYNSFFCARQTLIIEFFPTDASGMRAKRWPECIWWPSHFLGFRFYQVPTPLVNNIMTIEPKWIIDIFEQEL